MPETNEAIEQDTVDAAAAGLTATIGDSAEAITEVAETVGAVVTEAVPAAIVGVLDRVIATQSRTIQLLEAIDNNVTENLNALSRAQANTDVSAQRAAEGVMAIEEQISPPEETNPDQGERPADIKELPRVRNQQDERAVRFGFGKAAKRHGKAS